MFHLPSATARGLRLTGTLLPACASISWAFRKLCMNMEVCTRQAKQMLQGSPLEHLRSQKLIYDIFPSCQFARPSSPWKRRDLPCCQSEQLELKETATLAGLWLRLPVFPCKGLRTCSSTLPAGCSHHQSTRTSMGEDTRTIPSTSTATQFCQQSTGELHTGNTL